MSDMNSTLPSAPFPVAGRSFVDILRRAEWRLLGFICATLIGAVLILAIRQQAVQWLEFLFVIGVSLELVLIGALLRRAGRLPRVAMGLIGVGLYVCFSMSSAVFIFTLFPFTNPIIDHSLIAIDAAFGFSWVPFVEYVAGFPQFGLALRHIYGTILLQLAAVIFVLSFLRREVELHRFLTVGFVGMVMTDAIWWLFPSVGPAAYGMVSQAAQDNILLVANAEYGTYMAKLSTEGLALINIDSIAGVVAFPSFHIVLTCLVLWFMRGTWAFYPLLVLNLLMPVATVVHGGHHVVDLFGGLAVFAASLWIGNRLVPGPKPADP
jgi:hypothetical protein